MRESQKFWLPLTVSSNEPVDGNSSFDGSEPAELYWEQFYGEPIEWVEPKTNWTADDYYNFYDLNAVEINTEAIAQILEQYLKIIVNIITFTQRDMTRIEFSNEMNRIEGNIGALANAFYTPPGWEAPKTTWQSGLPGGGFSYRDANRLERNLYLLYKLIESAIDSLRYCGTFTCGEEDLII